MGRRTRTRLGRQFSEGARLTWLALAAKGWSITELCRRLRDKDGGPLARSGAHGWLYGDGGVSLFYALQIKALLDVPVEAWALAPTEPFTLAAEAA